VNLVGRHPELAQIEDAIDAARQGAGRSLVLVGEPGIGKSTLLTAARERGTDLLTLSAHGVESERDLAFAGLVELLSPLTTLLEELPAVQRSALASALAIDHGPPPDRFAIGAGVLGLVSLAAERERGVLLTIDDAQWLDSPSLEAVLFAVRRLEAEGIAVLIAARSEPQLDLSGERLTRLELGGLGAGEAEQLLDSAAPARLGPGAREAILRGAAGNPLALIEAPRSLSPNQLDGSEALPQPIPPSAAIERSFRGRLSELGGPTGEALVVAAAAEEIELSTLVDALAVLELPAEALEAAEAADVITSEGARVRFTHPLLRAVAYHQGTAAARRAAHAAIARALGPRELGRRALHLAEAADGPDEGVALALLEAAEQARERGAVASAGALVARAASLTNDADLAVERTAIAATDLIRAGHLEEARDLAQQVAGLSADELLNGELRRIRGLLLIRFGQLSLGHDVLIEAADLLAQLDPAEAARALLEATLRARVVGDHDDHERLALRALDLARSAVPPDHDVAGLAELQLAMVAVARGDGETAFSEIERHENLLLEPEPRLAAELNVGPIHAAVWIERFGWSERILGRQIDGARSRGTPTELTYPLCVLAQLEYRRGRFELARAHGDEAVRLAFDTQQPVLAVLGLGTLADIDAALGDEVACREHVDRLVAVCDETGIDGTRLWARALGVLALVRGDAQAALGPLADCERGELAIATAEPRILQLAGNLIEARVWAGHRDEAVATLERLETAERIIGGPWIRGAAARGRGLLGSDDEVDEHFGASVAAFHEGGALFEQARSALLWGERLRRARRRADSRVPLRQAVELLERTGSRPLADRARRELEATGETAAGSAAELRGELTPQELRIALRVAEGRTNPEVAGELFISRKTVERHLSQIYRKLGVRSRTELARVLSPMLPEHPSSAEVAVGNAAAS
jgi:DNA-binding CsgD family transcriptional regulator